MKVEILKLPEHYKEIEWEPSDRPETPMCKLHGSFQNIYNTLREREAPEEIMEKFFELCNYMGIGSLWET